MAGNISLVGSESLQLKINDRVIIVQLLLMIFLSINLLLIVTFFKKNYFYTRARYILFAVTLLSDSLLLFMSDILLVLNYFQVTMQVWLCAIFCVIAILYSVVTPVTLTAMTLERYVAICMPLRHAELCSTRSTFLCILIIHGLSSVPCIVVLVTFMASTSLSFHKQYVVCSALVLIFYRWQDHVWSAVHQLYFLIMCIIITLSYIKIMKAAKAASGEDKKSSRKGLRTVILHIFQLLLCLIQLWCPLIEAAVLPIDFMLYINVRYFNYIIFNLTPRCLSPLIYGLRDEKFFYELKSCALCGLYKTNEIQ